MTKHHIILYFVKFENNENQMLSVVCGGREDTEETIKDNLITVARDFGYEKDDITCDQMVTFRYFPSLDPLKENAKRN